MEGLYIIGGSPCSGKSTIAEMIAEKYDFNYFKVDDYLEQYMKKAQEDGKPLSARAMQMSPEETWMRSPRLQTEEELEIYREIFTYIWEALSTFPEKKKIITEGAAFLPELVSAVGVDKKHYINIVPGKDFQYHFYSQRPWVPYILEGCTDKKKAFENWMERDALFAETVHADAKQRGYACLVTDGSIGIDEMFRTVCNLFEL